MDYPNAVPLITKDAFSSTHLLDTPVAPNTSRCRLAAQDEEDTSGAASDISDKMRNFVQELTLGPASRSAGNDDGSSSYSKQDDQSTSTGIRGDFIHQRPSLRSVSPAERIQLTHILPETPVALSNMLRLRHCGESFAATPMPPALPAKLVTVVEIVNDSIQLREWSTQTLLRTIHHHNKLRTRSVDERGSVKLRDLRQLTTYATGHRFTFETRRNAIIVNLPAIRCIICYKLTLFIMPPSMGSSRKGTIEQYRQLFDAIAQLNAAEIQEPCEVVVLEAILFDVCCRISDRVLSLKADVDMTTAQFNMVAPSGVGHYENTVLQKVSVLKRQLGLEIDQAKGVKIALEELMNNDVDMRHLGISWFWDRPQDWDEPPDMPDANDVEILLESYTQEIDSLLLDLTRWEETLDDTLQVAQLQLGSVRNTFLKVEVGLTALSTSIGLVAAIASIFGMNLQSGYETTANIFWVLAFSMVAFMVVVVFVTLNFLSRLK